MKKSALREAIETGIVVTLITVLVWLYAEGESVRTYKEDVRVKFVAPPAQNLLIKPDSPTDNQGAIRVHVTFRASAHQRQEFRLKTIHNILKIPVSATPSQQTVVLKDALRQQTPIGELGLNIQQTDPQTENLTVEQLSTVTLPVQVDAGNLHLAQSPTVQPAQVQVSLPKQFVRRTTNAYVTAALTDLDPDQLTKVGVQQTVPVHLSLPVYLRGINAQVLTRTAKITFTIENLTDTITLPSIPIHINATPLLLRRYQVKLSSDKMVLPNVKLTGPADQINKIRQKQIKIWAEIRPTMGQMSRGVTTVPLYIHKPADVQVVSPIQPVPITVVPRQ